MISVLLALAALLVAGSSAYVIRKRPTFVATAPTTRVIAPHDGAPIVVVLGNDAVATIMPTADEYGTVADRRVSLPGLGRRHTTFGPFPADWTPAECLKALVHAWPFHSDAPPAWLESNGDGFAMLAAVEFGCPVGCPDDWKEDA